MWSVTNVDQYTYTDNTHARQIKCIQTLQAAFETTPGSVLEVLALAVLVVIVVESIVVK